MQLLLDFTERQSDAAFAALVTPHVNLVDSVARRQTGNPHAAEEITQAVFIILARKAGSLGPKTILSGWLYQTARLTAANFLRGQIRRQQREQEAYMQSLSNEAEPDVWPQIAPQLVEALGTSEDASRSWGVLGARASVLECGGPPPPFSRSRLWTHTKDATGAKCFSEILQQPLRPLRPWREKN